MAEANGKVYPVHNNIFKFGLKGLQSQTADMVTPKDLENFSPSIDGTVGRRRLGKGIHDGKEAELRLQGEAFRRGSGERLYREPRVEVRAGRYDEV